MGNSPCCFMHHGHASGRALPLVLLFRAAMPQRSFVKRPRRPAPKSPEEDPRATPSGHGAVPVLRSRARRTHRAPGIAEKLLLATDDLRKITNVMETVTANGETVDVCWLDVLARAPSSNAVIGKVLARVSRARAKSNASPCLSFEVILRLLKTAFAIQSATLLRYLIEHLEHTHEGGRKKRRTYPPLLMEHVADRMLEFWIGETHRPPQRSAFHRACMLDVCLRFIDAHKPGLFGYDLDEFAEALECAGSFDSQCAAFVLKKANLAAMIAATNSVRVDTFKFRRRIASNGVLKHLVWQQYGPPHTISPRVRKACRRVPKKREPFEACDVRSRRWSM